MSRLKRPGGGFTLLEVVIATALFAVILLAASNLLVNFGRFLSNFVKAESLLTGTALGALEQIVGRISVANEVAIQPEARINPPNNNYPAGSVNGRCVQIRMDQSLAGVFSPGDYSDDKLNTYWLDGTNLRRRGDLGDGGGGAIIASYITSFSVTREAYRNAITIVIESQIPSGPQGQISKEHLETTVVMRSREVG